MTKESHDNGLPDSVVRRLDLLRKQNNGILTPDIVLTDAEAGKSPLRSYFTWDDHSAARRHRLSEAGQLIQRYKFVIVATEGKVVKVAALEKIEPGPKGETQYRHIEDIMDDEEEYAALVRRVKAQLDSLRRRYESIVELKAVWKAIGTNVA